MNSRSFLFAASLLLVLVHPAFAQTDPHHPAGSGDATSSEQPASTEPPASVEPLAAPSDSSGVTCPPAMSMADMMMTMMQQGAADADMADPWMMEMMATMQTMQMSMMRQMQQMQQMQNDLMRAMPVQKQP